MTELEGFLRGSTGSALLRAAATEETYRKRQGTDAPGGREAEAEVEAEGAGAASVRVGAR